LHNSLFDRPSIGDRMAASRPLARKNIGNTCGLVQMGECGKRPNSSASADNFMFAPRRLRYGDSSGLAVGIEVSFMLPSFRLIAATFLCGFVVVFAGLRMAVSLHDIHEGLPVMAAHAAPVPITPVADSEARRGVAAVPVMYDLRFAVSTIAPTMVRISPTAYDQPVLPLSIWPPQAPEQDSEQNLAEPAKQTPESESTVAAIQPNTAATPAPDAPASLDAPAETSNPNTPAVAAIERQAIPDLEASAAEPLIPEPDSRVSVAALEPAAEPDPGVDPAAAAVPGPIAKPKAAKPKAARAKPTKPAPKAVVKVARKKGVRTAQHAAAATNPFGTAANNPFGSKPASHPFDFPRQ
jgi:hypothetical protein